jgi:hypothetical protein
MLELRQAPGYGEFRRWRVKRRRTNLTTNRNADGCAIFLLFIKTFVYYTQFPSNQGIQSTQSLSLNDELNKRKLQSGELAGAGKNNHRLWCLSRFAP